MFMIEHGLYGTASEIDSIVNPIISLLDGTTDLAYNDEHLSPPPSVDGSLLLPT